MASMRKLIERILATLTSTPEATAPAGSIAAPVGPVDATTAPRRQSVTPATPVYPPADYGIAYDDVEVVMGAQSDLLRRLRLLAGTDDGTFDRLYLTVVRNLAEHINQLPATEIGTHNGPGGLFRLALEIGFYALQSSEATIFSGREGAEVRRVVEPRWRYATFLAGLCIELHRPITSMIVVTDQGDEWPAFQISLGAWLAQKQTDRFFVRWHSNGAGEDAGRGAASYMVHKIIPDDCLQFLHEGHSRIVPTMLDAIMGTAERSATSPMFRILADVRSKVMRRDEAIRPANYGRMTVGTHLEPHLLDAMRRLVKNGTWKINEKKSRIWYGKDGLFLVWKTAAKEMIQLLEGDGVTGIPKDSQTLLDVLLKTGVFQLDTDGSPYWTILPPDASNDLIAIRFANPLTLFGDSHDEYVPVDKLQCGPPKAVASSEVAPQIVVGPAATTSEEAMPSEKVVDHATGEITPKTPSAAKTGKAPAKQQAADLTASGPGIAIPEVTTAMALPKDLQALFSTLTRDVIGCLLEDHLGGKTQSETGKVENGFAITVERLSGYGADPVVVIGELFAAGWLYAPPEKPEKKIHQIRLNNKDCQAVILQATAARDAGFIK